MDDCLEQLLQRCRGGVSFLVPQKEPASRRPQNSYRLLLNRSKILRLPILIIALLLRIADLVEQLTRIFLGIFGGLLHRFGSFLKGFVCYIRSIAHVVVRHSTAAVVAHNNLSFRFCFCFVPHPGCARGR